MGEFSHHSGPAGNSCCLFTLFLLAASASLVIGGLAWLWSAVS